MQEYVSGNIPRIYTGILSQTGISVYATLQSQKVVYAYLYNNNNNNNGEFLYSAHTMLCALHTYYPWSLDLFIHVYS